MTNYSQINLKQHKKTKKDAMVEFCKDNLIILDECHNATGDSATRKFLLSLTDVSKNIVYSSATFMKDESQLDLYEKTIDFDSETIELFKRLLRTDQELILRKIFRGKIKINTINTFVFLKGIKFFYKNKSTNQSERNNQYHREWNCPAFV